MADTSTEEQRDFAIKQAARFGGAGLAAMFSLWNELISANIEPGFAAELIFQSTLHSLWTFTNNATSPTMSKATFDAAVSDIIKGLPLQVEQFDKRPAEKKN